MWRYNSPIGPLYIKRLPDGHYGTIYSDTVWEYCNTPQEAADNVLMQCTGCSDWDMFDASNVDIPNDLSEWERC